ncbi:MAG: hypothetical protein PHF67_05545 [Candidatus Nanoarchaeia archaeon]|nr:hypothetical protein [Candidatus Nanoarchaeia archaeon]
MDELEKFLRSIDVIHLTSLVTVSDKDHSLVQRDGSKPRILRAFSPEVVKADISSLGLRELPKDCAQQANLRKKMADYITDSFDMYPERYNGANAYHLSHPVLWTRNDKPPITHFEYTVCFYRINSD